MLEKIDLGKKLTKKDKKRIVDEAVLRLGDLQRKLREENVPVVFVFEGWSAAGKGTLINKLIRPLDPRGFCVFSTQTPGKDEQLRPFMWRFWTKIPGKGRIHIFDRSWYQRSVIEIYENKEERAGLEKRWKDIVDFEKQLAADGTLIIKFFLHIEKKEQKKRFQVMEQNAATTWRVTKKDWKRNRNYNEYLTVYDDMLVKTDTDFAPWTIVEATDEAYAQAKIMTVACEKMQEFYEKTIEEKQNTGKEKKRVTKQQKPETVEIAEEKQDFRNGVLGGIDLSKDLSREEYKKRLRTLQEKLKNLHSLMYQKRIPVVLAFEGWDAGGKGGAIKRITENIDPRGYEVIPTAAPNDIERAHHYLWRFWNKMPKAGHLAIFDRTWYGRVMVERIEGFCSEEEWKRAYSEMNHMEEQLADAGAVVLKFWMHIDKDEQGRRFRERENTPEKQWKITEEDWRNREKWDEYEEAVDEMIVKTSTERAPWIIIEANSKYYARIKVLETIVAMLEKRLS